MSVKPVSVDDPTPAITNAGDVGGESPALVMARVGSGSSCAAPAAVQQLPAPALPRSRSPLLVSGVLRGGGRGRLVGVVGKKAVAITGAAVCCV